MESAAALLSIALALALGAASPGPSFVFVARMSLAGSRRDGLAAALGMGVGAVLFSLVALFGLLALLAAVPWLHAGLKLLGGAYLIYLGFRIWRGARQPLVVEAAGLRGGPGRAWRSFGLGLATQVSNPKTAVVYAGVFASLLPAELPALLLAGLPALVFVIEAGWYAAVALALSAPAPRARYLASKRWIDCGAGAAMSLLGLKLVFEARQP